MDSIRKPDIEYRAGMESEDIMNSFQSESRWIRCPLCGSKTRLKVNTDTVMFNFPLYCPKCKNESRIDVMQLKMAVSK